MNIDQKISPKCSELLMGGFKNYISTLFKFLYPLLLPPFVFLTSLLPSLCHITKIGKDPDPSLTSSLTNGEKD